MQKTCPVFNKSLRFSKTFYGVLAIVAFLLKSSYGSYLIGVISILMIIEMFSMKFSIPYQFHKKFLTKGAEEPIQKEKGELSFVCGMAGIPLFVSFLLLSSGQYVNVAWVIVLALAGLLLLSGIVGLCVATLSYVLFKKAFKIK